MRSLSLWKHPELVFTSFGLRQALPGRLSLASLGRVCGHPKPSEKTKRLTFLSLRLVALLQYLYQTDLRMDAKGVTPIPAPTNITTS